MNIELLAEAIKNGERINTTTHALGSGEWSIEVHGSKSGFMGEYIGLHGDDLWSAYHADYAKAEKMAGKLNLTLKSVGNGGRNQRRR